jgi:type IV pilus assembly protein PilB
MLSQDDFVIAALLEEGRLTRAQAEEAGKRAAEKRIEKSAALVEMGVATGRELAILRASLCECPFVDLAQYDIDIANAALLPRGVAEKMRVFPLFDLGEQVTVGMADPLDLRAVDQARALLKCDVEPVLCEAEALRGLISRAYSLAAGGAAAVVRDEDAVQSSMTAADEPMVAAVNQIIAQGIEENASDIHLGPDETNLHLRYRIDGALQPRQGPSLGAHPGLVQRLKVMANLDLTVTRRPQDGKFRFVHNGKTVDVRLSIIPTVCGENVVMRLLASNATIKGFAELGFPPAEREAFEQIIESPHGMILVTGPTGSGKTTTLYTAVKRLNTPDVNVITIEDPVEIRLPMVRQVQVHSEIGMTFAGALRSILRQDPDIVLVGEIRDEETARIAVQAALTGHLVLSTLHTNDAPGAVARLRDFGLPAFAINASVLCVIAQRLVKRVCGQCAAPERPHGALLSRFGLTGEETGFVNGAGCARCASTGYRGRIGVYEMLRMTAAVQRAVDRALPTAALRRVAQEDGMRPMWMDGLEKARVGLTTLAEVARVVATELVEEGEQDAARPADRAGAAVGADDNVRLSA